eukprot:31416-Pelagococcus_subviridis.AAC.21
MRVLRERRRRSDACERKRTVVKPPARSLRLRVSRHLNHSSPRLAEHDVRPERLRRPPRGRPVRGASEGRAAADDGDPEETGEHREDGRACAVDPSLRSIVDRRPSKSVERVRSDRA